MFSVVRVLARTRTYAVGGEGGAGRWSSESIKRRLIQDAAAQPTSNTVDTIIFVLASTKSLNRNSDSVGGSTRGGNRNSRKTVVARTFRA